MARNDLGAWELLVRSDALGSVAAASESLGLDQATAGRMLARLEQSVGRPLYVRRVRPFKLTLAGLLAADKMRGVLGAYEEAMESLRRDASELRGLIRLSAAAGHARE
ncbi:MAG: LysR family transcriptional regulator, partial [Duodenibacillus sp.]|nr:LysR family transcriptional regulator [Duodenibacillus sp.]